MRVGFIGLGRMGQGMARRILGAGHELSVFDMVAAATGPFGEAGARVASSIADLCAGRDVVVTMLVEDKAIVDVALGAGGLCDSLPRGAIHLVMGTHGVATVRQLEARHRDAGQTLVAAPVLGRPDLAASGQLGIVAGGPEDAVGKCEPLLSAMGRKTFPAGARPESATAIKLANNAVLGCAMVAMAEGRHSISGDRDGKIFQYLDKQLSKMAGGDMIAIRALSALLLVPLSTTCLPPVEAPARPTAGLREDRKSVV